MKRNSIVPMLPVSRLADSIDFFVRLGFTVEQRQDGWRWAMLRFGDSLLMLDESIRGHAGLPAAGVLYLYPESIADYHAQLRRGGLDVPALETTFYGMTEFRIDDPDGNRLWIGQPAAAPA